MKTLKTLIKIHSQALDEKRRIMAGLEQKKQQFLDALATIQENIAAERDYAAKSTDTQFMFASYLKRMLLRQEAIRQELAQLEQKITALAEEIREGFGELKRYEIALERKIAQTEEKEMKEENAMLDEIGIRGFMRDKQDKE